MSAGMQVLASFLVGGVWVAAATAVAERRGTRLGGFIGGMPSTLAVALLFVGWTGGGPAAASAAAVVPLACAVNALFLLLFAALTARWGFHAGLLAALAAWAVLQGAIVALDGAPLWGSVVGGALALAICRVGFHRALKIQARPPGGPKGGLSGLALRAGSSGLLVAAAVGASLRWGAVAGGVLASLPVSSFCVAEGMAMSQGTSQIEPPSM